LFTYTPGVRDYRPLARAAASAQTPAPRGPGRSRVGLYRPHAVWI